ncbi:MAG: hypothetical protein FWD98_07600 [Defluviitaleaceae bacterium]|nr:hypothetical protein [Defluviitaleaceae bacterium]
MFGPNRNWGIVTAVFFAFMFVWMSRVDFHNNALGTLVGAVVFAAVFAAFEKIYKYVKDYIENRG